MHLGLGLKFDTSEGFIYGEIKDFKISLEKRFRK